MHGIACNILYDFSDLKKWKKKFLKSNSQKQWELFPAI